MRSIFNKKIALVAMFGIGALTVFALSKDESPESCTTPRCHLENDPVYAERFNPSVRLLLDPPNAPTKDFIQKTKRHDRELFSLFFDQISKNMDRADFPGRMFKSCAVVGNSPNLLGKGYGEQIDAHEAVIRMNMGPTRGYEADVGEKTSFRVSYSPFFAHETKNGSMFLIYPHPKITRKYRPLIDSNVRYWDYISVMARVMNNDRRKNKNRSVYFTRNSERLPKESLLIFDPRFLDYVEHYWFQDPEKPDGAPPTSGIISLVFALHACDQVSLFGFGEDASGKYTHYFGSERHNARRPTVIPSVLNNQNRLIGDLAKKGIVSIYFPDPTL